MFKFKTVYKQNQNFPYSFAVEQEGSITSEQEINKTGRCTVNDYQIEPGERILVRGYKRIPLGLKSTRVYEVVLDWDGCELTQFPNPEYFNESLPIQELFFD